MKKLQILLVDPWLPREIIEHALSVELGISILNFSKSVRTQLQIEDNLGHKMREKISKGKLFTPDLYDESIKRSLQTISTDTIISGYPQTAEQFIRFTKVLSKEEFIINQFWYFKLKNPVQFIGKQCEYLEQKHSLAKFVNKIPKILITGIDKRQKSILEIQKLAASPKWNILELAIEPKANTEKIKAIIKKFRAINS